MDKEKYEPYIFRDRDSKPLLTYEGKLLLAHEYGLCYIYTEKEDTDSSFFIVRATIQVKIKEEVFTYTGYGEAHKEKDKTMEGSLLRLAETRAISRAITNGFSPYIEQYLKEFTTPIQVIEHDSIHCSNVDCKKICSKKETDYSIEHFGRALCFNCQKIIKKQQQELEAQ